jgi:hypothetical protein
MEKQLSHSRNNVAEKEWSLGVTGAILDFPLVVAFVFTPAYAKRSWFLRQGGGLHLQCWNVSHADNLAFACGTSNR